MKNFPYNKYQFYTAKKVNGEPYRVIAVSTYAGRKVRGVAKCAPDDKFDMDKGKMLAAARCNLKVAEKRRNRAMKKKAEAIRKKDEANDYYAKMFSYFNDSFIAYEEAKAKLHIIEDSL